MNTVPEYRTHIAIEIFGTKNQELKRYFEYYDQLVLPDDNVHTVQIQQPQPGDRTPITHIDVLAAARVIREAPTRTLDETSDSLYRELQARHSRARVKDVVLLAARVMFMFDPETIEKHGSDFAIGSYRPCSWQPAQTLHQLVLNCFPQALVSSESVKQAMADRRVMKAWKLKARSGIIFKGTDNLAQHLLLDRPNRILYIFHHASFLKAQLRRFQVSGPNQAEDVLMYLQRGSLPPRLLAETLHSLQSVLFQWRDHRSDRILKHLIKRKEFDENCAWEEGNATFKGSSKDLEYFYWGHRLVELHDLAKDRRPRNRFERWVKWQTSESNAFAIALAALIISVAVGLLSLALSAFQAWITWKAWKDSIKIGNEP